LNAATAMGWIEAFDPGRDELLAQTRRHILQFLESSPEPFLRTSYDPGHVTASGLVVSPDLSSFLIVRHRRLGKWIQPGGHVEPQDRDTHRTAQREVIEETRVRLRPSSPELAGLDIHPIAASRREPGHLHFDLAFLLIAADNRLDESAETLRCRWCPWDGADAFSLDASVRRHAQRARHLVRSSALSIAQ